MRNITEANLTDAVRSRTNAPDPRVAEITDSLIRHLHAWVREIEPTEEEWWTAIQFLTETGKICDDARQEFVLLSDTLGVSMLVDAINHRRGSANSTESTVLGPFHAPADRKEHGEMVARGPEAERADPCVVRGRVLAADSTPIPGATVDIWQAADDGYYDVQPEGGQPERNLRGVFTTGPAGEFWFRTVVPRYYPVPTDGPVGALLTAMGRHPMRPAHIHFIIEAEGYHRLVTHIFKAGDEYLDTDAVFGVKESLIVDFVRNDDLDAATELGFDRPFYEVAYDFLLASES